MNFNINTYEYEYVKDKISYMHTSSIDILYDQHIMVHTKSSEAADLFAG